MQAAVPVTNFHAVGISFNETFHYCKVYTIRIDVEINGNMQSCLTALGESLELLSDEMEVFACRHSLKKSGLQEGDLIEDVKIDDGKALEHALKKSRSIMIF